MIDRIAFFSVVMLGFAWCFWVNPADLHPFGGEPQPFCATMDPPVDQVEMIGERDSLFAVGEQHFRMHCARCHSMNPLVDLTGPGLVGFRDRIPEGDWIYDWIQDSQQLVKKEDPYALEIYNKWDGIIMEPNPLTRTEIDQLLHFLDVLSEASQE